MVVPKDILSDFQRYVKIYHDSISESLRKLLCDGDSLFPFIKLEYNWKKYSKFRLFMAIMMIKNMLSEGDEIIDWNDSQGFGKYFLDNLSNDFGQINDYNQRIIDIITVMAENRWIGAVGRNCRKYSSV
ncbi:hypothetical protein NQ314_010797 [Rhamnusium bicolor]|uniref:Uncharacterized protein n=1 Tax=Rhamnusium bicolor TaxID=1586634 RepID=A0AAV8XP43_9CUCU|nr:hypothetical protein NQ314_010797 [Rhamnusium bicolor]